MYRDNAESLPPLSSVLLYGHSVAKVREFVKLAVVWLTIVVSFIHFQIIFVVGENPVERGAPVSVVLSVQKFRVSAVCKDGLSEIQDFALVVLNAPFFKTLAHFVSTLLRDRRNSREVYANGVPEFHHVGVRVLVTLRLDLFGQFVAVLKEVQRSGAEPQKAVGEAKEFETDAIVDDHIKGFAIDVQVGGGNVATIVGHNERLTVTLALGEKGVQAGESHRAVLFD